MQKTKQEKIEYWFDLANDDLGAAKAMLKSRYFLHSGFLCHLTIEKALKAAVTNNTDEIPPKTHDLRKLASIGGVFDKLSDPQLKLIETLMPLQIEGRYPDFKEKIAQTLTEGYCEKIIRETESLLCWIKQQLGN
jgi:HEPN domain-containing protein